MRTLIAHANLRFHILYTKHPCVVIDVIPKNRSEIYGCALSAFKILHSIMASPREIYISVINQDMPASHLRTEAQALQEKGYGRF
jgi:hypothetical protein